MSHTDHTSPAHRSSDANLPQPPPGSESQAAPQSPPREAGSFTVQREEPLPLLDRLREILIETRHMNISPERMRWMYQANPDGAAALWTIRERTSGKLAGFTVGLPRRMIVAGQSRLGWNCADFSVLPAYRTLGLAIRLRRAAREEIDAGRMDLLYAHPNERMQPIHERAGHVGVGSILRYAFVLRAARYVRERVRPPWLGAAAGRIVGATVDPLLYLRSPAGRRRSSVEIQIENAPRFDDRFDRLFADNAGALAVQGVRDARYLHWRYAAHPIYRTQAVVARRDGMLVGYALFTQHEGVAILKDVFPPLGREIVADLVCGLLRYLRSTNAETVSFWALEGNPVATALLELGFLRRPEISQMFAYAATRSSMQSCLFDRRSWHITHGDRDI